MKIVPHRIGRTIETRNRRNAATDCSRGSIILPGDPLGIELVQKKFRYLLGKLSF
jgi:hypothetical protein